MRYVTAAIFLSLFALAAFAAPAAPQETTQSHALVMYAARAGTQTPDDSGVNDWNATRLFGIAQSSFIAPSDGDDAAKAVSYWTMAELRLEADRYCFPPVDEKEVQRFDRADAWLASRLRPVMVKHTVLSQMVVDLQAWAPVGPPAYSPGWTYKSQCSDYTAFITQIRNSSLQRSKILLELYKQPGYEEAYTVFSDVRQDYDRPPSDDAYSPTRLKQLADAVQTMRTIEQARHEPFVGTLAALSHPIAFHVLGGSQPDGAIEYPGEKDGAQGMFGLHIIQDQATFQRLWDAVDAGFVPMPLPAVDFSRQVVVFLQQGQRDVSASYGFINRMELTEGPSPVLMVYLRTPISLDQCPKSGSPRYPYLIAVIDKPEHLLGMGTGGDDQNFPVFACPVGITPSWPPGWMHVADTRVEPAHGIYLGGYRAVPGADGQERRDGLAESWAKLTYKMPQKLGDKEYVTELVQVRFDCGKMDYSRLRDIKLDALGTVVSDDRTVTDVMPLPRDFEGNLGELPADESIAMDVVGLDCERDGD